MNRSRGFTLVELIVVIMLIGIIAGTLTAVFRPTLQGYLDVGRRANLSNQADIVVRRLLADVRRAVPNSLRLRDAQTVELLPTLDGGRYRTRPDTAWDAVAANTPSAWIDGTGPVSQFDVVTRPGAAIGSGDLVVIGNQDPDDVYSRANVGEIRQVTAYPANKPAAPGRYRVTLALAVQFPPGADSGRFVIVPNAEQAVSYRCEGVGVDGQGTGTGTFYRYQAYGISLAPGALPTDNRRQIVATKVANCQFEYDPNQGATQQSGFLQIRLTLADSGEQVNLVYGAHVRNVP